MIETSPPATIDVPPTAKKKRPRGRPTLSDEELLNRVLDLFLEHGFEGTSIEAITSAAGMAKRTLYVRYGDKESLLVAALRKAIEDFGVPVERLREAETPDLEETLCEIARILIHQIMSEKGLRLLKITNAESGRRPEIGTFTYKLGTEPMIDYLADLFRRRVGEPDRGDADWREAATAFLNSVVSGPGTKSAWGLKFDETTIERDIRYSVHLFIYGLLPRGGSAADVESCGASATAEGPDALVSLREENTLLRKLLVDAMLKQAAAPSA